MQNWCYNIEMMPVWAEGENETNTSQNEGQGSNKNSCQSISQCKIYYIHSVSSYLHGHEQTNIQDLSFLHFLQCASHTRQITATKMKRKVNYMKHTHENVCGSEDDDVTPFIDCHSLFPPCTWSARKMLWYCNRPERLLYLNEGNFSPGTNVG